MGETSRNPVVGWADHIGIWWAIIGPNGVVSVVMSVVFAFFEPVAKHGWAAVVLAGIASSVLLLLFLAIAAAVAAWALRKWKPLSSELAKRASPTREPEYLPTPTRDMDALRAEVTALREEVRGHIGTSRDVLRTIGDGVKRNATAIRKLEVLYKHIVWREAEKVVNDVLGTIDELLEKNERAPGLPDSADRPPGEGGANSYFAPNLRDLSHRLTVVSGDLGTVWQELQAKEAEIRQDAAYYVLNDDAERERFKDGGTKRQYFVVKLSLERLKAELTSMKSRGGPDRVQPARFLHDVQQAAAHDK